MQQGHNKSFESVQSADVAKRGPQVLDLATLAQISGGGPHGGWQTTPTPGTTAVATGPHGGWLTATADGPHGGW